jgi:hypothetical protein
MTTQLSSKDVAIRKDRQCLLCYRKFSIGTIMNYWVGIVEDTFTSNYSCLTCKEIINNSEDDGYGFPEGYVHECLDKNQTPEEYLVELKTIKEKCEK